MGRSRRQGDGARAVDGQRLANDRVNEGAHFTAKRGDFADQRGGDVGVGEEGVGRDVGGGGGIERT